MGTRPHVRLRPLTHAEQQTLSQKLKDLSLSARIHQRYRVIEEVRRGRSPLDAAERAGCHFTVAYAWIRRFNRTGFSTFEQVPNPRGRPPILRASQIDELVEVARSDPSEHGLAFPRWSVPKLAEYCRRRGLLPRVSDEWVRRLLRREGVVLGPGAVPASRGVPALGSLAGPPAATRRAVHASLAEP